MYRGDQSRKQTLVDYGFRLPSAMDNRPLKFDEFESYKFQTIYGFGIYIPFISVWVGGIAGLIFNFFFSRKVVFDS